MHALLDNALGRPIGPDVRSGGAESIASGGDEAEAERGSLSLYARRLTCHTRSMLCDSDGVVSNSQSS